MSCHHTHNAHIHVVLEVTRNSHTHRRFEFELDVIAQRLNWKQIIGFFRRTKRGETQCVPIENMPIFGVVGDLRGEMHNTHTVTYTCRHAHANVKPKN